MSFSPFSNSSEQKKKSLSRSEVHSCEQSTKRTLATAAAVSWMMYTGRQTRKTERVHCTLGKRLKRWACLEFHLLLSCTLRLSLEHCRRLNLDFIEHFQYTFAVFSDCCIRTGCTHARKLNFFSALDRSYSHTLSPTVIADTWAYFTFSLCLKPKNVDFFHFSSYFFLLFSVFSLSVTDANLHSSSR